MARLDLLKDADWRAQALDKALEAADEPSRTLSFACDRSLEIESLNEDTSHATLVE
jgi:hypothetical protein